MEKGTLRVTVVEGIDLLEISKSRNSISKTKSSKRNVLEVNDGICVVLQLGQQLISTGCIFYYPLRSCTWQEDFLFENAALSDELKVICVIRNKNFSFIGDISSIYNKDGFIGEVLIPISRLPQSEKVEQWYQLYSNIPETKTIRSALKLILEYIPHGSQEDISITSKVVEKEENEYIKKSLESYSSESFNRLEEKYLISGIADYLVTVGPFYLSHDQQQQQQQQQQQTFDNSEACVLHRYPMEDKESFPLPTKIEWFCFPGGLKSISSEECPPKQIFTFVLVGGTDGLSRSFGNCLITYFKQDKRQINDNLPNSTSIWFPICMCLVSRLPLVSSLTSCLCQLHLLWSNSRNKTILEDYIVQLTEEIPMPISGIMDVQFSIQGLVISCSLPKFNDFPVLPFSLMPLFKKFSIENIIRLFSFLACECKMVIHSQELALLSIIAESLCSLIYPFKWQHPYVPILPRVLAEYIQAPLPFVLGVHSDWLQDVLETSSDFVLLVDIDKGTIEGYDDLPALPITQSLRLNQQVHELIAKNGLENDFSSALEQNIRLEFLYYITDLLNGYRDCLFFVDEKLPVFNRKRFFRTHANPEAIPFLTRFFTTQAFEIFLENHDAVELVTFHTVYQYLRRKRGQLWPYGVNERQKTLSPSASFANLPMTPLFIYPEKREEEFYISDRILKHQTLDIDKCPLHLSPHGIRKAKQWTYEEVAKLMNVENDWFLQHHEVSFTPPLSPPTTRHLSSVEEQVELALQRCMARIFSSELLSETDTQACESCFNSQYARDLFLLILMQPGHRVEVGSRYLTQCKVNWSKTQGEGSCLGSVGFDSLVRLANCMLSICEVKEDYVNARGLLQVSANYYRLVDELGESSSLGSTFARKEYLQPYLRGQSICRNLVFWEHTFRVAIEAELDSIKLKPLSRMDEKTLDNGDELFFSHIGSLVYDMLSMDVPVEKVKTFVKGICRSHNLSDELEDTLNQLVQNLGKAVKLTEATSQHNKGTPKREEKSVSNKQFRRKSSNSKNLSSSMQSYDLDTVIWRKVALESQRESSIQRLSSGEIVKEGDSRSQENKGLELIGTSMSGVNEAPILCIASNENLVASGSTDSKITIWDLKKRIALFSLTGHEDPVSVVQFNGKTLISASYDKTVRVWQLRDSKKSYGIISRVRTPSHKHNILKGHKGPIICCELGRQLNHDSVLFASGSSDKTIRLWKSSSDKCQASLLSHSGSVSCVRFAAQNDALISGSHDCTAKIWDASTATLLLTMSGHTSWIRDLQVSGDRIITASNDRMLRVWDSRSTESTAILQGHLGPVKCVSLGSPTDPIIISGSADGTVKIWDMRSVERGCTLSLEGHQSKVTCLHRDFTKVISGSIDTTVRIWDVHHGECLFTCKGHLSGVSCLSVDELHIISGSWDSTVRVWYADSVEVEF